MPRAAGSASTSKKLYLTTHQVAGLLEVSLPTVVNWIEAGKLSAHRTPGGHRRIGRDEVVRFCRIYHYPIPPSLIADAGRVRVLIAESDPDLGAMMQDYLQLRGSYDIHVAMSAFEAGFIMGRVKPQIVLLDPTLPGMALHRLRDLIGAPDGDGAAVRVFVCTALRGTRETTLANVVDGFIEKPIRWELLHDTLQQALT